MILTQIIHLVKKDFLVEWRNKAFIQSLLLYIGGTVFITYISFSIKTRGISPITWNAIFWILLFFSALQGVNKSFLSETKSRFFYYYYTLNPTALIFSKIIFNFLILFGVGLLSFGALYVVFEIPIGDIEMFFLTIFLGAISFSTSLSLLSAISSKAGNASGLLPILSVPVVIPLIMLLIKISNHAIEGLTRSAIWDEVGILCTINVILFTVSYLLFPYLWKS